MTQYDNTPDYVLEDRTGSNTATDWDELYDRIFFRVARVPSQTTTMIYPMSIRSSRHRDGQPFTSQPTVVMEFSPDDRLGNLTYVRQKPHHNVVVPMNRYLRKTSLFGSSLVRKFTASDGREYTWAHKMTEEHEWTCTSPDNVLVAHLIVKAPGARSYDPTVSGNYLTIIKNFSHLTLEILTSLTIMRHIQQHNL